jgi:ribosomal protein L34E
MHGSLSVSPTRRLPFQPISRHAENKRCPECGAAFECLARSGANDCWCMKLPRLPMPTDAAADCLCATCLRAQIEKNLSHGLSPD